jgi:uncharacterized membrane protein
MTTLPALSPRLGGPSLYARDLPPDAALIWLKAGWRDFCAQPGLSLAYGFAVFAASAAVVAGLFVQGWDAMLFPALAGFMVVGPILAVGLYEKSRRLALGERVSLVQMIVVRPAAGVRQMLFVGVLLLLLMLLWMRAAVLLYALFFGWRPFLGLDQLVPTLIATVPGLGLLVVGGLVGGLFAAFAFAISAFSIPMLLDKRIDAFTAMGASLALTWRNLPAMIGWGAAVLGLFLFSLATGLLGLVVAFPLLGHATWRAYDAVRR